jgi:hypothetical protein
VTVLIPLYRRGVIGHALVDDADAEIVGARRWNVLPTGYAVSRDSAGSVYMHRLVIGLGAGDSRQVDHINRDKLDNRRENLRVCTAAQNHQNKPSYRNSTSPFRGVSRDRSKWRATVVLAGVQHFLGYFTDELDAARAAAQFRAQHMPFSIEDPALLGEAA